MLLEFSCANFRSINEKCTLSLKPRSISDEPKNNIAKIGKKTSVLKVIALYGANSSGKSNFIQAFSAMMYQIFESVKLNEDDKLIFNPFKLLQPNNKPTFFEIVFTSGDTVYRYGFEHNDIRICGEWLYSSPIDHKKETVLFIRTEEGIGVNEHAFKEGDGKEESTVDNRLFLSLCAQLNGPLSKKILSELRTMNVLSGIESRNYMGYTKFMLHKHFDEFDKVIDFYNKIQLGFNSIETKEMTFEEETLPSGLPAEVKEELFKKFKDRKSIRLFSTHNVYDKNGKVVGTTKFDIDEESDGTNKLIDLSGPIFDTLAHGKVLWLDELDAKMHALISQFIIVLFENPETNPHNAQLIFSTHDTHLLSSRLLRRDQIWFTEKDPKEQTDLYSMMDIELPDGSKPRNDSNYEKNYIAGRYGAIPFIIND